MTTDSAPTTEDPTTIIDVDGLQVAVTVCADDDGVKFVQLGGINCNLNGYEPGLYYPSAIPAATAT